MAGAVVAVVAVRLRGCRSLRSPRGRARAVRRNGPRSPRPAELHPPLITSALVGAVVVTALRLGVLTRELPYAAAARLGLSGRGLLSRRYHTLISSQLLARNALMVASIVLSLVVVLGAYEALAGSVRAAAVAASTAIAPPLVITLVLAAGSGVLHLSFAARTLSTIDYGASAITVGGGGALVSVLGRRWVRRGATLVVLAGVLVHHQLADWSRLVAFLLGYAAASLPTPSVASRLGEHIAAIRPRTRARVTATAIVVVVLGVVAGGATSSIVVTRTASAAPPPSSAEGEAAKAPRSPLRVIDTRYPTPSLGGDRRVLVVVPPGYDDDDVVRYPAIELLHGSPSRPDDILTALDLLSVMERSRPFIAVIPDGNGPVVRNGDWADTSRQRLGAAASDDLRQWVDHTYRTTGYWGITGLSAGGFGAAYLASRTPGAYQRACPISGYFVAENPAFNGETKAVRDAASPILHVSRAGPPTLVAVGASDASGVTAADAYIAAMKRVGQAHDLVVLPGPHDATVWSAALPKCVDFLLAGQQPPP